MKQLSLIPKPKTEHGGSLTYGKRKSFKPLDTKQTTHLVLKCHRHISLYQNLAFIQKTLRRQSELSGVQIYSQSVQHDHIHINLRFSHRHQYNKFVRQVTSLLSRKFGRGMWKFRPYTKVVKWGRQLQNLKAYLHQNDLEVRGEIPYQLRGRKK